MLHHNKEKKRILSVFNCSQLKTDRSPGTDRYTAEWYKSLRDVLVSLLHRTLNYALKKGVIPHSWKEAYISVIPKEAKDKLECSSYRPISALNQDYRLFSAILPDIIHLDLIGTGFIKGRPTQDNKTQRKKRKLILGLALLLNVV